MNRLSYRSRRITTKGGKVKAQPKDRAIRPAGKGMSMIGRLALSSCTYLLAYPSALWNGCSGGLAPSFYLPASTESRFLLVLGRGMEREEEIRRRR